MAILFWISTINEREFLLLHILSAFSIVSILDFGHSNWYIMGVLLFICYLSVLFESPNHGSFCNAKNHHPMQNDQPFLHLKGWPVHFIHLIAIGTLEKGVKRIKKKKKNLSFLDLIKPLGTVHDKEKRKGNKHFCTLNYFLHDTFPTGIVVPPSNESRKWDSLWLLVY